MGLVMKKVELQAGPCIIHTVPRPHLHTRAANEGSRIFHNHGEGPEYGLLLLLVESTYPRFHSQDTKTKAVIVKSS